MLCFLVNIIVALDLVYLCIVLIGEEVFLFIDHFSFTLNIVDVLLSVLPNSLILLIKSLLTV